MPANDEASDSSQAIDVIAALTCGACGRLSAAPGEAGNAFIMRNESEYLHGEAADYQPIRLCGGCAYRCARCQRRAYNGERCWIGTILPGGGQLCRSCAPPVRACQVCGGPHLASAMAPSLYDEDSRLCPRCHESEVEEPVEREQSCPIEDHDYRPAPLFSRIERGKVVSAGARGAGKRLYFGIEVEAEAPRESDEDSVGDDADSTREALGGFFYVKSDGSLNNGFELVSHPATIDWWRQFNLAPLKALANNGYRSFRTTTCGMHVHFSRNAVSELALFKLCRLFKESKRFVARLSRRTGDSLKRWAKIDGSPCRDIVRKVKGELNDSRYMALNLSNARTVECRIFRGTLHPLAVLRNIEALHAMIRFAECQPMNRMTQRALVTWLASAEAAVQLSRPAVKLIAPWLAGFLDSRDMRTELPTRGLRDDYTDGDVACPAAVASDVPGPEGRES